MAGFTVGQQIVYPSQGIGVVEGIEERALGPTKLACYNLRLADNSLVTVPVNNAVAIGLRVPLSAAECESMFGALAEDFNAPASDWKDRFKDFSEKMRTGSLFDIACVLKHLTYLGLIKSLSFREQRLLEKAQYLVVSELTAVCRLPECDVTERVQGILSATCAKHLADDAKTLAAASH